MEFKTLAVVVLALTVVALFLYYALQPRPLPSIPHRRRLAWMTGDIPFIARIRMETGLWTRGFEMMAMELGPICQTVIGVGHSWVSKWIGFGRVMVILSDSQEIYDILVNRSAEFDRSFDTINLSYATVPEGMISLPTGSKFKHHKRWLGPSMNAFYIGRMIPRMTESITELLDLWSLSSERLRRNDSIELAFDALDDIWHTASDVMASITFGASFNSVRAAITFLEADQQAKASKRPPMPALAGALRQLLDKIGENALFPVPSLLTWWTRTFATEWKRARKQIYHFLEAQLDKAREDYEASSQDESKSSARFADNVLDMILIKEREGNLKGEKPLNRNEILDELATYAVAGSETVATTMQWSIKILTQHPEVQRKLHHELVDNLPATEQRLATYEEWSSTDRLPYLSAVVYEILRVSRTAVGVTRVTTRDTTILGRHIPKGTSVLFLLAHSQQHESGSYKVTSDQLNDVRSVSSRKTGRKWGYWDDEDCAAFRPERWLTAEGAFNSNAGPWMPFGFGFRGCFGQRLAMFELRMFVGLIQARFFLDKIPEELDSSAALEGLTTHPKQCYIRPIPWSEMA